MIWTKLKKTSEALLADSLKGRIEYHITRYGSGISCFMARGWITLDKKEIVNFSTIKRFRDSYDLSGEWYSADKQVADTLDLQGVFTRDDFVDALETYVKSPVEVSLLSPNPIVRALAMPDRRLGKRRLSKLSIGESEHQFVETFYRIRCRAEGLLPDARCSRSR